MSLMEKLRLSIASSNSSEENKIPLDETCGFEVGCGSCRRKRCPAYFCQCFATTRWALVFLSLGAIMQGFLINGTTPVVISTLEKRFELTSTESGLIASCYDIAGSIAILYVTYVGGNGHKPLWIGWGIFLIGISGILFSLPHFMAPIYSFTDAINLCGNAATELCTISALKNFRFWFYGAFIIAGVGSAPLYSLSITYLDENVKQRYSSFYNAIFIAMSIIGPGAGFLVGAAFLEEYLYPGQTVSINESSELWVGAWWIGYLIFGIIGVFVAIPALMLPKVIPGTEQHRLDRENETHRSSKESEEEKEFGKTLRDFPRCIMLLLRNPTFAFMSLSIAVDSLLIGGVATFGPKYLEIQFGIDASEAGVYFGLMAILGGAGGQLIGGGLISKLDLSVKKMLHMSYVAPILAAVCSSCYFITCSNPQFAGVTVGYQDSLSLKPTINDQCNGGCGCSLDVYNPVCGSDGLTYYSSCFAGCSDKVGETFTNCSCVSPSNTILPTNMTTSATSGACLDDRCSTGWEIVIFCLFNFLVMFFTFFNEASALQASMRCVSFSRRSFAIGIQILLSRLLGTVPGPLVMGAVFDSACLQWTEDCGVRGSCLEYSSKDLSVYVSIFIIIGKVIGAALFIAALLTYKPVSEKTGSETNVCNSDNQSNDSGFPTELQESTTSRANSLVTDQPSSVNYGTALPGQVFASGRSQGGFVNPIFTED